MLDLLSAGVHRSLVRLGCVSWQFSAVDPRIIALVDEAPGRLAVLARSAADAVPSTRRFIRLKLGADGHGVHQRSSLKTADRTASASLPSGPVAIVTPPRRGGPARHQPQHDRDNLRRCRVQEQVIGKCGGDVVNGERRAQSVRMCRTTPDTDLDAVLRQVSEDVAPEIGRGKVADYIPALARVDARSFGMSATTVGGARAAVGDAAATFSMQSISKIFALTLALEQVGSSLWDRVGREPSGDPFNSLVQLEYEAGIPRNPLINAGALVVTDVLISRYGAEGAIRAILEFVRLVAGNSDISVDTEVMESERAWGFRNASLANLMKSFANLDSEPQDVLEVYFHQCAIALSCVDLSRALMYLVAGGRDPLSGRTVVSQQRARRINALMLTCGHYDASGEFAFRVGLPGKSGVGGGIAAIAPGALGLAVWSPGLNEQGNSLAGTLALERFSQLTGHSIF